MLIGENGNKQELSKEAALSLAEEQGLDLVQVSKTEDTVVCKIMDYSKFVYDQKKKEKHSNKAKQELKEVRLSDAIADNDIKVKVKTAIRILNEGDKVQVTITYKGRMIAFIKRGLDKLLEFEKLIECDHVVDKQPNIMGNRVSMILSPKK